jgi:Ser/Thr protein kinase RdoA (MazF antagonist)
MIKALETLYEHYQDAVLGVVVERYGIEHVSLTKLGSFESIVYEAEHNGLIVKITHSCRRTHDEVIGELEFVRFLSEHDVSVSPPVLSRRGKLVETFRVDPGYFILYALRKAPGHEPLSHELTADFYEAWGQVTGRIHAVSKRFQPSHPAVKRPEWDDEDVLNFSKYVPSSQRRVHEQRDALFGTLQALPQSPDSYGLIHNDLHYGNVVIDDGHFTVFDFDDCRYHWFVNDIAIAVHSVLPGYHRVAQFDAVTRHFMTHFMRGYFQENPIDPCWLDHIPDFLKLYDLINYGVIYQTWDMHHLSHAQRTALKRIQHRIEHSLCIVDTDFRGFGN